MTLEQIITMLQATDYPVAYRSFKTKQNTPYICVVLQYSNNFVADGRVYLSVNHVQIELYTDKKDTEAEARVENLLNNAEIVWSKSETYIQTEKVFQIIYEIEV